MNVMLSSSETDNLARLRTLVEKLGMWREHIEKALRYADDTHTFDDIVGLVLTNHLLFFATDDCFAIMERVEYPQYADLRCFLVGGSMTALMAKIDTMRELAVRLNCKHLTMAGRRGWDRILSQKGWKHSNVSMSILAGED